MALTLTFIVTNEDGFGRRETLPWGGESEARRPLGGLAELGEGSHLSPSKYAPPSSPFFSRPQGNTGTRTDWGP